MGTDIKDRSFDITSYKTADAASRAAFRVLIHTCKKRNISQKNLFYFSPQKAGVYGYPPTYTIFWEEGPKRWAENLFNGSSTLGVKSKPEILLHAAEGWFCSVIEEGYGLQFFQRKS